MYEVHLDVPHTPPNARLLTHRNQRQSLGGVEAVELLLIALGKFLSLHIAELLQLDELLTLLHLVRLVRTGARGLVLMGTSTVGCQVSIVDGWENRDRSGRAHVLVTVLIDQVLELAGNHLGFIQKHMIVSWACSTLDSRVRVKVKVILERMSDITLHQGAWVGISVLISGCGSLLGEETNVVTLRAHGNGELDLLSGQREDQLVVLL